MFCYNVKKTRFSKKKGQMTLEMVLILVVLMTTSTIVLKAFKEDKYIAAFVTEPWKSISCMIESGTWICGEGDLEYARTKHPNHYDRFTNRQGINPTK